MASLENRIKKLEQLFKEKRKRRTLMNNSYVFILPDDEKCYQEYQRYVKAHPEEDDSVLIILPANGRELRS